MIGLQELEIIKFLENISETGNKDCGFFKTFLNFQKELNTKRELFDIESK